MLSIFDEDSCDESVIGLQDYEEYYGSCDYNTGSNTSKYKATARRQRPSLWLCLKVSLETTVVCGMIVGLLATFFWWLELNVKTYCFTEWNKIPEDLHRRRLIVDIFIADLAQFWVFSCIAPVCDWKTIKKLSLAYICTISALLDTINRLILFIFSYYSKRLKYYIGSTLFLLTSFKVCHNYAQHYKADSDTRCNAFVLALKLSLQFSCGILVSTPFTMVFLDFYYHSSSFERTILACTLIIAFAIPKLFINHVVTNLHGICTSGDEIMFVIAYMTATTICARLMQAQTEELSYFTIISLVHGILNVTDKLSLPLKRKILLWICCNRKRKYKHQLTLEKTSLFLANQTLFSIITETTSAIFSSAAAYLLLYYYKKEENTRERHNGYLLFKEMVTRGSIAVSIELVFNVIAVKIQTHLYQIPVIGVWKKKWKSILIVHTIQVLLITLYFSQFINKVLLMDYYKEANITCLGQFKRV